MTRPEAPLAVAMVTTSWPSARLPYAGHFVASMADALSTAGAHVTVVAPEFSSDGGLLAKPNITLKAAPNRGVAGGLAHSPSRWLSTLTSLRRTAATVPTSTWLAHWWPTSWAVPRRSCAAIVLHGSDMDLLERMPRLAARPLARQLASRPIAAVAPHLASRFDAILGRPHAQVLPLGAEPPPGDSGVAPEDLTIDQQRWWHSARTRVLTVARDAPGKGLWVARRAMSRLRQVDWLVVDGVPPVHPTTVWRLIERADLVAVPSEQAPGLPSEGCPYIIRQALACGVPLVGGNNAAVIAALGDAHQAVVQSAGAEAFARAVAECIEPRRLRQLGVNAEDAGRSVRWSQALSGWLELLARTQKTG